MIMIHSYSLFGQNIVMDIYSGAIHLMEPPAFALCRYYQDIGAFEQTLSDAAKQAMAQYLDDEVQQAHKELTALYENNTLFSTDVYSEVAKHVKQNSVVKALCLHIVHDCNLRCKYCFAQDGTYRGVKGFMSFEVGKAAIDFVIKNSGSRKNIEIDFFGGEPLMNFKVVKQITEYCKEQEQKTDKLFRLTITTNGMLLDDAKTEYINDNMVNVVLSLDGRKSVHDKMRFLPDGSGSYDRVVKNYEKFVSARGDKDYFVRGTFTRDNLDFAKDVLHIADLGFKQTSVEPVVAPPQANYSLREEDVPAICAEYETLAQAYMQAEKDGDGFSFFHFMVDLEQGPCIIKRLRGCGAGSEYLAVTPAGDIYPCHQFADQVDFKMGNVLTGEFNTDAQEKFSGINVYTKPACKECFAKFYCSGGCHANACQANYDLNVPYEIGCKLQRKRLECAIAIKACQA